jgi:hypothetical protein
MKQGCDHLLALFLVLSGSVTAGHASVITNYLENGWGRFAMAMNVGDTMVWVNQQASGLGSNFVESYSGEWKSPPLNAGDSFSYTFTSAGFYAYRTGLYRLPRAGVVAINNSTNTPLGVTINTPIDGATLPSWPRLLQASVAHSENLVQIEYFANSVSVGTSSAADFSIEWGDVPEGRYVLAAKATHRNGVVTWSPSVTITVGAPIDVWGSRVLPTGEFLFFFNVVGNEHLYLGYSNTVMFTNASFLDRALYSGVYVDETAPDAAAMMRFYGIVYGP